MDTYRGNFVDQGLGDERTDYDYAEDETGREAPPSPVGQDERRMQVRAYNHWASLLENRNFPSIEDLDAENLPDFGPYSVLLDFTGGIENPAILFLGDQLAAECGANDEIDSLSDVPSRSLLSRITDHYMQILANQAPIGFEAEFVNQREKTILYRGILLPFSSDDDTIDFIYGVINWKELADQRTTDELLLEVDQALEVQAIPEPRHDELLTDWADGPADAGLADGAGNVLDLGQFGLSEGSELELPEPGFGSLADAMLPELIRPELAVPEVPAVAAPSYARYEDTRDLDAGDALLAGEIADPDGMGLADWLASARELALAAHGSEDRTRQALYAAIGRAYDFSLAAQSAPEEFAELVADSGLTVQERAPLIPVVKLVFGAEYDKTRLTEYASALSHAHRIGLARGELARYLGSAPGGLKGVIVEERRRKREEEGKRAETRLTLREAVLRELRELEGFPFEAVPADGSEFTLLVARRLPSGEVVVLGEVADDIPLLEKAAKKLLAA